jgi:membrane protease YdiL (CAAX protease family)
MLLAVKNHFWCTAALLAVFVAGSLAARAALGLVWHMEVPFGQLLLAIGVMAASDGAGHALLTLSLGESYLSRYRALVEYFRPQGIREILAGGLLAGGEELVFRGVLLEGLHSRLDLSPAAAVGVTALVFGLLHAAPSGPLRPFLPWAIWEGALLGAVYVISGSLMGVIILHVLHDIAGFSLFAHQRRTSWLMGRR